MFFKKYKSLKSENEKLAKECIELKLQIADIEKYRIESLKIELDCANGIISSIKGIVDKLNPNIRLNAIKDIREILNGGVND